MKQFVLLLAGLLTAYGAGAQGGICTVSPAGPVMLCQGGSVVLTASSGTSYQWSNGQSTQSITVSQAGTYSVVIDGCTSNSVQVFAAGISPANPALCSTVVLEASGGVEKSRTFNWTGSGSFVTETMNIGPYTAVTNFTIGYKTYAAVYGSGFRSYTQIPMSYSIDLYNPETAAWVTIFSGSIIGEQDLRGFSFSFPSISSVSRVRFSCRQEYEGEGFLRFINNGGIDFTLVEHPGPFTYLWSTGSRLRDITVSQAGTYSVSINGCAPVSTTVVNAPRPGDPAVFGQNTWNVYVWKEGYGTLTFPAWQNNYSGYYTDASLSFDTRSKWAGLTAPSAADNYQGCPVGTDNHSWSAKRQGFPCGTYTLAITGHDDAAQLFIDGVNVWQHDGCCDNHPNVWTGKLDATTKIEFRATEGAQVSFGALSIIQVKPVITPSSYTAFCPGQSVVLSASAGNNYLWSTGATTKEITVTESGVYTVQENDVCGNPVSSDPVTVTVQPMAVPVVMLDDINICDGARLHPGGYLNGDGYTYAWFKAGSPDTVSTEYSFGTFTPGDYYVIVSRNGCSSPASAARRIDPPSKGDPAVFGNGVWNVYAWSDHNYGYGTPNYGYAGYYTETALSFNTTSRWDIWESPSSASGYTGCYVYEDYFRFSAKRKGFPCGRYRIDIPGHDDGAELLINGVQVWQHLDGCCDSHAAVWEGALGPDSKVEYRVTEIDDAAKGAITFTLLSSNVVAKPTISPSGPVTVCSNSSVTLASSSATGNLWSTGANTQSIAVNTAGSYTVTVTGSEGCTAQSDAVQVSINAPISVSIPDAKALSSGVNANTVYIGYTPASSLTLKASASGGSGGFTYKWSTNAATQAITVSPTVATTYTVTVTDAKGCTATATKGVAVMDVRCGNKLDKVSVCHGGGASCIDKTSVADHLAHGDYLGTCTVSNAVTGTTNRVSDISVAKADQPDQLTVSAYPNPSRTAFTVQVGSAGKATEKVVLRISDAVGRTVETRTVQGGSTLQVGAGYRPGIYFVEIVQGEERRALKLIKQ